MPALAEVTPSAGRHDARVRNAVYQDGQVYRVNVGMIGINVPIPVPLAYFTFGGWKKSGFGDLNQHGPDAFRFYTLTKTVTARWPSGIKEGAAFNFKAMD